MFLASAGSPVANTKPTWEYDKTEQIIMVDKRLIEPPSTDVHWDFLTFGAGSFPLRRASRRLALEAASSGFFRHVNGETEKTISRLNLPEWPSVLEFASRNSRGFGYWSWKPLILQYFLSQGEEESGIVYLDAGCSFNLTSMAAKMEFQRYLTIAEETGSLATRLPTPEHLITNWTRASVIERLGATADETSSGMVQAGVIMLRRTPENRELVRDWVKLSLQNSFENLVDAPPGEQNSPEFLEHRQDQSIFSILANRYGISTIPDETYFDGAWHTDGANAPIWTIRNRTGISPHGFQLSETPDHIYRGANWILRRLLNRTS